MENKKSFFRVLFVLIIFTLLTVKTAWAQNPATIGSISYNSTLGAYEIASANNLHDLAVYVNGSGTYSDNTTKNSTVHDCTGLTFKLTGNIELAHTTAWNDTYSTEENYTPIGRGTKAFKGTFDGCGYTISGIRIYRTGQNNEVVDFLGLFGQIEGTVQNVTVSDARITGRQIIGGISGDNWQGTISNCTVTNTVCIHSRQNNAHTHGGIVGRNYSDSHDAIVSGCTSSVQFSMTDYHTGIGKQGGIVGWNRRCSSGHNSVISNCLVLGATIMTNNDDYAKTGAIIGENIDSGDLSHAATNNIGTLTNNYYSNCTVSNYASSVSTNIGVGNTSGVPGDVTENDGARHVGKITLAAGVSVTNGICVTVGSTKYYYVGAEIALGHNREGYTFVGYSSDDVTISEGGTFTMPATDVTINSTWRKQITITADSDTKTYDGTALTKNTYTNTALETGDVIESVTITGSQTNVGTSDNVPSAAVIKNGSNEDVTANYEITYVNGTLTITPYELSEMDGITDQIATLVAGQQVKFTRTFAADKASTICLPFAMTSISGGKVYEFRNVTYDDVEGWVATMSDATPGGNKVTSTVANKPYLFLPESDGEVTFRGKVPASVAADTIVNGDWKFHGTYSRLDYGDEGFSGIVFGFAATDGKAANGVTDVEAGQFVKAASGAYILPFRAYLTYSGSNSALKAPGRGIIETPAIPDRIKVRLLSSDGTTTATGTIDMNTGEITIDQWYYLNGQPVNGDPTTPGLYFNSDGKKVMITE